MKPDVFRECRGRVTARQAAERYGLEVNRQGWVRCPFHGGGCERTPSLKFYTDGRFFCFACNAGGSVIDFTARLYGLSPLEAVKKLDADFHLGLPLGGPETPQERRKTQHEADRRAGITELYGSFEKWRSSTINDLNGCIYLGNLVEREMSDPGELSEIAALALREREHMAYLSDVLSFGTPEEQVQVWAERKKVERWINNLSRSC